jgi:PleD family two-component response regulator
VAPGDGPPTTLLRRADAALLEAKSGGRNRTVTAAQLAA